MPALVTQRIRFLHVPKTGGTWVWLALKASGVRFEVLGFPPPDARTNHWGLRETEDYADRFTIAFIRHPLDWWRSLWAYRMRDGWDPARTVDAIAGSDDFDTFTERVIEHLPGHLEARFARYIGPPSQPIDFIGRYETLTDDLVRALKAAGEEFDEQALHTFGPENTNDYQRYPAVYRRDLAVRLAEMEAPLIERFYPDEPLPAGVPIAPTPLRRRIRRALARTLPT